MNFKKALIFSAILHICLFTATLLLSADMGGSSKILDEKVVFVKLAEDVNISGEGQFIVKTNLATEKKSVSVKTDAPIENLMNIQPTKVHENYHPPLTPPIKGGETVEDVPLSGRTFSETPSPLAAYGSLSTAHRGEAKGEGLNVHEEPSAHIALANYESRENAGNKGTVVNKGRETSSTEIIETIRDSIERVKTYPLLARKRGLEGTVHVSFSINPDGEPVEITVLKSSGARILDISTLNVIKKAAPFPYTEERIEVPVTYKLMN